MTVRAKLITILAAAFILRVILIAVFRTYQHPVTWEYEIIVNNILSGRGFVYDVFGVPYRSFNNPLYSYLSTLIYLATNHSYLAMLLVQSVVSVFLAVVIFNTGKTLFGDTAGLISAAATSFHPGLVYYDVFNLIPMSIDAFFIASAAFLFLRSKDSPTALNMSLVGGVIGLGVMSRGIIGALMPFFAIYILCLSGKAMKIRLKAALFLSLATFLVVAPWVIRNYIIHKEVMIISMTGETFWRGNNKYAVGTSFSGDGRTILDQWPDEFKRSILALDEIGQKKFFEREARDFIRGNPRRFIELYLKKVFYFWWFSPQSGAIYPRIYLTLYKCIYFIVAAFFLLGVLKATIFCGKAMRNNSMVLIFVFAAICLTQSLFYVEGRHRWIIEPLMLVFFSYGLIEARRYLERRVLR